MLCESRKKIRGKEKEKKSEEMSTTEQLNELVVLFFITRVAKLIYLHTIIIFLAIILALLHTLLKYRIVIFEHICINIGIDRFIVQHRTC